jgi:hypothetical protein
MKEVVSVDVFKALHNLEKYAFDAGAVKALVISSFHQLVKVTIHVFHTDVEFLAEGIKEDV